MTDRLTPAQLDAVLALQLTVAWAGERAGEPPRLGWWSSDLVDPLGGADLFLRLVPRTAPWASLILVRRIAQRIDEEQQRARGRTRSPCATLSSEAASRRARTRARLCARP